MWSNYHPPPPQSIVKLYINVPYMVFGCYDDIEYSQSAVDVLSKCGSQRNPLKTTLW